MAGKTVSNRDDGMDEVFRALEEAQARYENTLYLATLDYLTSSVAIVPEPPRTDLPLSLTNVQFI